RRARARARPRPPARAPDRGRLVEGRARDQRHDGGGGPAAAAVPRPPRSGRPARDRRVDPLQAGRRRWLVDLLRRSARPVGDDRGVDGAAPGRRSRGRRAHAARGGAGARAGRGGALARLPALPPEVILLPSWFPLNVYDFASWARQTIVPLCVVASFRPQRPLGFDLGALRTGHWEPERLPLRTWGGRFQALDRALHLYEKRPFGPLRRHALALCAEWILRRQEADGCWGGIQPPWVYSIMALHLLGYPMDHPALKKAWDGLESFAIHEPGVRRFEACQSPVWDTALAMVALRDAGVPPDHPAMRRGAEYLLSQEIRVQGDWAVRRPNLAPGGWAFEFENDNYPDIDDTAEVILALRASGADRARIEGAVRRAIDWTLGMQCKDGGWAAFDVDNTQRLCGELPFCDFGEVIDPP